MQVLQENATGRVSAPLQATNQGWQRSIKRCVDVLGSLLLIVLLSPVFLIIGVLVLALDGNPILFRRQCVGPRGKFDAFKFRTMRRDADQVLQRDPALRDAFRQNFNLKSHPRGTKLGAVLR